MQSYFAQMPPLLTSLWVPTQNLHILFNQMLSSIVMMMIKKNKKTNVNLKITINYISSNRTWRNKFLVASNFCDLYCANYCSYITLCLVNGNFFPEDLWKLTWTGDVIFLQMLAICAGAHTSCRSGEAQSRGAAATVIHQTLVITCGKTQRKINVIFNAVWRHYTQVKMSNKPYFLFFKAATLKLQCARTHSFTWTFWMN